MNSDEFDCDHVPRCEDATGHGFLSELLYHMTRPITEEELNMTSTNHLYCFRFYHPRKTEQ